MVASASEGGGRTAQAKIVASALPSSLLARPALEARLDEAFGKRLTVVVAGAGFGKSTLLAAWAADVSCAWYTVDATDDRLSVLARGIADAVGVVAPGLSAEMAAELEAAATAPSGDPVSADAFAAQACERLGRAVGHDLVLVLDDLHELDPANSGARLVQGLLRHAPSTVHLVLASRAEPPFSIARLRGRGEVLELDASDLAFSEADVAALLVARLGDDAQALAGALHGATGGWPAEVRLAVEALRPLPTDERLDALTRLLGPEGPLLAYLAEEVLLHEPSDLLALLRRVAWLDRVSPGLCEALGVPEARGTLAALARRGLLVQREGDVDGWYSLHALLREVVRDRWPLAPRELRALQKRAGAWFAANDHPVEALRYTVEAADRAVISRLLAERARELLSAGGAEAVLSAAELLPPENRDESVEVAVGEAHALKGEWEQALACYGRAAGGDDALAPGLAVRMVRIHFERGDFEAALDVAARGSIDGSSPRDESLLLGLIAQIRRALGEPDAAATVLAEQLRLATVSGEPLALAAAHNNLMLQAMANDDQRAVEAHFRQAVRAAEASGEPRPIIRVHRDRAGHLGGREAVAELETPLRLAELTGADTYLGVLLDARGEVLYRLGLFEDAISDLTRAITILDRVGSMRACSPLVTLGAVYRDRGQLARSRAAYERAVPLAEEAGEVQWLVAAHGGLARVLARQEPDDAIAASARSVELARTFGIGRVWALVDAGWVHLACGDREHAASLAHEAEEAGRRQPERAALASALELRAQAVASPGAAAAVLEEALEIWRDEGSLVGVARTELALALLSASPLRPAVERAEGKLRSAGVGVQAAAVAAGPLACLPSLDPPAVAVRTLGGFAVFREGRPIPLSVWGSKKARDLLQILVSRRGRPVARDLVMEALWPGEDPARLGNRLSVALSLLRAALDPDRRHDQEHFVASGRRTLSLDATHVATDLDDFLTDGEAGLALRDRGSGREARDLLIAAEARYAGDFLEEVYDDWAVGPRENARSLYVRVARALADDASAAADNDAAARYFLRILERDPHDEHAHLQLVGSLSRAGRHGDAQRSYRVYCARMEEIGVEAAPYPRAMSS